MHDSGSRGATLKKADLTGADLHAARLQRADLSGAKIDDIAYRRSNIWSEHNPVTTFSTAEFDEDTRFPETGRFPEGLIWAGSGIDPRNKDAWAIASKASACSPKELLVVLKAMPWDGSRISSALDMLKAEQFELFADSTKEHVIGVIRSQRDPGLVYACRLSNSGAFSCCTQNLRACGGLRGALCKHLLVLLLGLAKDGRLPANRIADWIVASRSQKPKLDKEVMSDTFIRYKGAEAGDIDWRPVETVPEDFYAF